MGQYYKIINHDKKEVLTPGMCGDGLKLGELDLVLQCLKLLLADGNGKGGGDHCYNHPIIGWWIGDKIAIVGDYQETPVLGVKYHETENFKNITLDIVKVLIQDPYYYERFDNNVLDNHYRKLVQGHKIPNIKNYINE